MRFLVTTPALPHQSFNIKPFLLNQETLYLPITFEITLFLDGIRYQYCFSLVKERILSESLLVYKTERPQKWFERTFNEKTKQDDYKFSKSFEGNRKVWERSTRQNTLFFINSSTIK